MEVEACHYDAQQDLLRLRPSAESLAERTQVARFVHLWDATPATSTLRPSES